MNKEKQPQVDTEILELPEALVEQLVCKQVLNPVEVENSMFIQQNFKAQWFKNEELTTLFQICRNYWLKYNGCPTTEIMYKILENDRFKDKKSKLISIVDQLYNIDESKYDKQYLQDTLINFTKGRAIYYAILDNIDDIEKNGDIGNCLSRFEDIVKIGIDDDLGIEYFENIDNHIKDLTSKEQRIPFNWKEWDKYTFGGIPVGEACLFVIMAQPGLGKSQMMMNIGYQYLQQNKNVLMVSLEMSEQMYSRRMSALFSDINVNQLKDCTEILKKKVAISKMNNPKSRLFIKQYSPNEFNSIKLKHYLDKLKKSKNFIPDLIIVDYLNIMTTNNSAYHMNSYERVGTISKELRSVSIETKIPILTRYPSK